MSCCLCGGSCEPKAGLDVGRCCAGLKKLIDLSRGRRRRQGREKDRQGLGQEAKAEAGARTSTKTRPSKVEGGPCGSFRIGEVRSSAARREEQQGTV